MKVIHVISGGDSGGAKTHLISLAKELKKHIDIKIVCFIEGDFYKEALKCNLPVVLIKQSNRVEAFKSKKFLDFIEKEKPDVIHAHGARANFNIYLAKSKIKCPVITTVHSDYKLDFKDNIYKYIVFTMLNKLSLKHFDYYIGVSSEFKKMLVERGYAEDKIYTVYNGVDFNEKLDIKTKEEFAKDHKLEKHLDKKWIGNLSRLELVKGVDVFINAASIVIEKLKEKSKDLKVHFVIAGDGTQRENIEKQIKELNLESHVSLLGFIDDVTSMYNAIDINVISSHSESFTYSLLEGARQKKASVASRVGGLPLMIDDKKTGVLFDDNDHEKLACEIIKIIEDDKLKTMYGENFYNVAKEKFSTENMGREHIDIYEQVISRGK